MAKYVAITAFETGQLAFQHARSQGDTPLLSRVQAILTLEKFYQESRSPAAKIKWLSGIGTHLNFLERETAQSDQEEEYRKDILAAYEYGLDSRSAKVIIDGLREQMGNRQNK